MSACDNGEQQHLSRVSGSHTTRSPRPSARGIAWSVRACYGPLLVLCIAFSLPAHAVVTYDGTDGVAAKIFTNNSQRACNDCHSTSAIDRHSAPVEVNFNTYSEASATSIYGHHPTRASERINASTMPVNDSLAPLPLNSTEKSLIAQWVADGSLQRAAPEVTTNAAILITKTSGFISGTVKENGAETSFSFKYATNSFLIGASTVNVTSPTGSGGGTSSKSISTSLSSLTCGTTYYFRAIGTNSVGTTNGSLLNFTTSACNQSPTITSTAVTTATEDQPYSYDVNATDPEFNTLTYSLTTKPTGMTINSSTGLISWTPTEGVLNANVTVSVSDGGADGAAPATQSFTINVTPVNDSPVAVNDVSSTDEDNPVIIDILGNDSDIDGTLNGATVTLTSGPFNGSTSLNTSTGAITYTPDAHYFGADSFTYRVQDNEGALSNTASVSITVNEVNDAPVAANDATSTDEDNAVVIDVLANDSDVDGTLDVSSVIAGTASNGNVSVDTVTGRITYTPNSHFNGADSFTYRVRDNDNTLSNAATVDVTVNDINDNPVASDDSDSTNEDNAVVIDILANDTDIDGTLNPASVIIVSDVANGSTSLNPATGEITYTPDAHFNGPDQFTYTVQDDDGGTSNTATVNLTINPVNDAPTANDDNTSTAEDTAVQIDILANDSDLDGSLDATSVVITTATTQGSTSIHPVTGVVTYTPDNHYFGADGFTYTVLDNLGEVSNTATVSITVNAVNDPPSITSTAPASAVEGNLYQYQVSVSDVDDSNNGSDLSFSLSNAPAGMTISNTGLIQWTPGNGVTTSGLVTVTVNDGGEDGAPADSEDFTVSVTAFNQPPTITSNAGTSATEDTLYQYAVQVTDPDDANNGVDLGFSLSNAPAGMTVSNTGLIQWTPTEGVLSSGSVTVQVADGGEDGATAASETFTVTVTPVNDAPTITSTANTSATEDSLYQYVVQVSDPDDANNGVDLAFSLSNAPAGMTVSSTGLIQWTPTEGVLSSGSVTVQVADGGEDGATAASETFTVTVAPVNDAPTITSAANTSATEDTLYQYAVQVSDPDDANNGVDLGFSLSNAPAGMTVSSTGLISWTPTEGVLSSGSVTVQVADGGENGALPDTQTFTVTVTPVNDAPQITSNAPVSVVAETLYQYAVQVSDPDDSNNGSDLSFSLTNAPTGMSISATGVISWTPTISQTTSGAVTVTVNDGGENGASADSETFTVTVVAVNQPPVITSNAGPTATEDVLYQYAVQVSDPDDSNNGVDLSFSLTNAPTGMSIGNTGLIQWTPSEGVLTSGSVTVQVADGGENGATPDTETFTVSVTPVNDAPNITSVAPTSATEAQLYSYAAQVSDPDDSNNGSDLSFTLSNAPTGMTVSNTGLVQWTPGEGVLTSGAVTLQVADGGEDGVAADSELFTLTVTPVNQGPAIISAAPTSAIERQPYQYAVVVSDPDDANNGADLTFSLNNAPTGMTISSIGLIEWTPGEGVSTSGTVTVRVADGGEDGATAASQSFTVSVTAVNQGPTITSTANANATEDSLYQYAVAVDDPDDSNNGVDLAFSLSNAPSGMTISNTGLIEWTPTEGVLTSGTVTVSVQDGGEDGAISDSETFTVTVTAVNDAPVITSSPSTSAVVGELYQYALTIDDPDDSNNGTDLSFNLTTAPAGMSVSNTGLITWTPAATSAGEAVTVEVSDGGEDGATAASQSFSITVAAGNQAPAITSTAPTTAQEDVLYEYQVQVNDPDDANNGVDLSFSLNDAPSGMSINATGLIQWTPAEGVLTSGTVTVTVADGGESGALPDSESFTVTVTAINDAPTITSSPALAATEGQPYQYQVEASDPDDSLAELNFSLSDGPVDMTISSTGLIEWTPAEGVTQAGPLTVTVSDGGEDGAAPATQSFTVMVTTVNQGPTITSSPITTATEGMLYEYDLQVSDPDDANNGSDLTFSLTGAPDGMSISTTGQIQWTPGEGILTSGEVTVSVSDGGEDGSVSASQTFTITVTPVNQGPQITSLPGTSATEDSPYSYALVIDDPDDSNNGSDLTFSLTGAPDGMTISATGQIQWTPTEGVLTAGPVTVSVSDGGEDGATPAEQSFSIAVTAVNDAPQITSAAPDTAIEDTPFSYQVEVLDPDDANNGNDLIFILLNPPAGMELSNTGLLQWTPTEGILSSGTVDIHVADGGEDGSTVAIQSLTLSVTPVNDPPQIQPLGQAVVLELQSLQLQAGASDVDDSPDGLFWSLVNAPSGMTIDNNGLISWTPGQATAGDYTITVSVADGGEDEAAPSTTPLQISVIQPDQDNDGVADYADNCPLDANPNQENFDGDSEGDLCDNDDDNDRIPDIVELNNGLNPFDPNDADLDLDGDSLSNRDEYESCLILGDLSCEVITSDNIPPVITVSPLLQVAATGYTTAVTLSASATDARDGAVIPRPDQSGPFVSGRHLIRWTASDQNGNQGQAFQTLEVRPQVELSGIQVVGEDQTVRVEVQLSGPAPDYPVVLDYTVSGDADQTDHTLRDGQLTIGSGASGFIEFHTQADTQIEADETVFIDLTQGSENISLSDQRRHEVRIVDRQIAPEVSIVIEQAGKVRAHLFRDLGLITLTAQAFDANGDAITLNWGGSDSRLDLTEGTATQTLDPLDASLATGLYELQVSASDAFATTLQRSRFILHEQSPELLASVDSDGDGLSDASEGLDDLDGDGVPEYLDPFNSPIELSTLNGDNYPAQNGAAGAPRRLLIEKGLRLQLGPLALKKSKHGAQLTSLDITDDDGMPMTDPEFEVLGGVYDFRIAGLNEAKRQARLVIPLNLAIPPAARYRKLSQGVWRDFVVGANDSIASAPLIDGRCPAADHESYVDGLQPFHRCLRLTLSDGGPNDDDSQVNGVIDDPGGIAVAATNDTSGPAPGPATPTSSPSGGGTMPPLTLGLMLLLWALQHLSAHKTARSRTHKQ